MLRKFLIIGTLVSLLVLLIIGAVGTWAYYYITRDLPQLTSAEDYSPSAVSSIYANDGSLIGEFYEERRYPISIQKIPQLIRNCFIAAEDASFYSHKGIDPISILRATIKNIEHGSARQGASTITQQVVKNLLLTSERSMKRKLKEAYLSYQLEQHLSKDEILELYLNQIFFGNSAYGLRAAALAYFRKEPDALTLAEGAMLAGLPKAPSEYSPISNYQRAKRRQKYVLGQMVRAGFITEQQSADAEAEHIKVYRADLNKIFAAPYYVTEVRRILTESPRWKELNIDHDALSIYTAVDLTADRMATAALRKGLREVDKRRGWRGPLGSIEKADSANFIHRYRASLPATLSTYTPYPALVTGISRQKGFLTVDLGGFTGRLHFKEMQWAQKQLSSNDHVSYRRPEESIAVGDVIEVSIVPDEAKSQQGTRSDEPQSLPSMEGVHLVLDETPDIEGSLVLIDPHSGYVRAAIGGYSYQRSQFNRVTQGMRQPGSAFKPIIYLAAVDGFKYTPATIVFDRPRTFRVGDEFWTPGNFDSSFMGDITLRTALQHSRNLVSADIVSRIGIDPVIQYAKKLGIESRLGRNLSLSLGSSEVTMLELARAYGVFAAKGVLFDSVFITKIVDRRGKVLFDVEQEKLAHAKQVLDENSAFIMANMMKGVVEHGTGYRVREIGRPTAGKTGTSNDQMDAWFIGFTPNWVCGVWSGFDVKKPIGDKETGGRVSAPIWLYFMSDYLREQDRIAYARLEEEARAEAARLGTEYAPPEPLTPIDFSVPSGVEPYWVDKTTGRLSDAGAPNAIFEYFIRGTEPSSIGDGAEATSYLDSPEL